MSDHSPEAKVLPSKEMRAAVRRSVGALLFISIMLAAITLTITVFAFLFRLAYTILSAFSKWLPDGPDELARSLRPEDAGDLVWTYLAAVPTRPDVYFFFAILFGAVAAWRWRVHAAPADPLVKPNGGHRSGALLWVAHEQRRRARSLRTGAVFLLASAVVILVSGLYFTAVVVPFVREFDENVSQRRAVFEDRYGSYLDAAAKGLLWVTVPHEFSDSPDLGSGWYLGFNSTGSVGLALVARQFGETDKLLSTSDGGRSWTTAQGFDGNLLEDFAMNFVATSGTPTMNLHGDPVNIDLRHHFVFGGGDKGRDVLALAASGKAFHSEDGGSNWEKVSITLQSENSSIRDPRIRKVVHSWRGPDNSAFVLTESGALHWTNRSGNASPRFDIDSESGDNSNFTIRSAYSSPDGRNVVVESVENNAFSIKCGELKDGEGNGTTYHLPLTSPDTDELGFATDETLMTAAFAVDGSIVLVGSNGMVKVKDSCEINGWKSSRGLDGLADGENWALFALSALPENSGHGTLISTWGTVFSTENAGADWTRRGSIGLRALEKIDFRAPSAFSADATHGVIVGPVDSVFLTKDGGETWASTERFADKQDIVEVAIFAKRDDDQRVRYAAAALDRSGHLYNLEPHLELSGWRELAIETVLKKMTESSVLKNSQLYRDMSNFIINPGDVARLADSGRGDGSPWEILRDQNLALRLITIVFLFFLVAMFVRLYQYNLRMAAFWESKSDALVLATESSAKDSVSIGELAAALSPDAYDFKSGPRTVLERMNPLGGTRRGDGSRGPNQG